MSAPTLKKAALEIQQALIDQGEDSTVELTTDDGVETMHVKFMSCAGEISFKFRNDKYLKFDLITKVGQRCPLDNVYTLDRFLDAMPLTVALIQGKGTPVSRIDH